MKSVLQQIFSIPLINGASINGCIFISRFFVIIIYVLIAVIIGFTTVYFVTKKFTFSHALKNSVLIAFFSSGLIYAIYAETIWFSWLTEDLQTFGGLNTGEEKLQMWEESVYNLAIRPQKPLPSTDYALYSSNTYYGLLLEYYLLPLRKREEAPFIIVFRDKEARFDMNTGTLIRGDERIENLELYYFLHPDAYILKKR